MNVDAILAKPHLDGIFNLLRSGKHLSVDDGPLYLELRAEYGQYRHLFKALGFDLVNHERGFYYFRSGDDVHKEATHLVVFFFVLVEWWGDGGHDLEAVAFDAGGHSLADLPHFSRESWRACMEEAGVPNEDELANVVKRLERYGFAQRIGEERFRFLTPAWRFFDLCREVWQESANANDASVAEEAP